jgi:hypothetical protein
MIGRVRGLIAVAAIALLATPATAWGSFALEPGSPYTVGADPYGVVAADFNGDQRNDVAVVNGTSSNLSVLLRQPAGGFAQEAGSPFGVGAGPNYGAVADFNGDGRIDVAVANFASGSVSVMLRQPGGGFAPEPGSPVGVQGQASAVAASDFNGDGRPDLAVATYSGVVTVLLRNPAGDGFTFEGNAPAGASPRQLAVADFNGDGRPDLAVANLGSNNVTILLRAAGGGFTTEGQALAVGGQPAGLTAADFNADGKPDLAVSNSGTSTVSILLRTAANDGFAEELGSPLAVATTPIGIASADFDRDGRPDLAVASNSGAVTVLRRGAGGGFIADPAIAITRAYGVAVADFNGDAYPDLAVTGDGANAVSVLLNTFAPATPPPTPAPTPTPTPIPPPVVGKSVNALPVEGKVKLRLPGTNRFISLDQAKQLPVGTTVDARDGRLTLVTSVGHGKTEKADFFDGQFKLSQTTGSRPVTTLILNETLRCPRGRTSAGAAAAKPKTRKLWGDGKGTFRTKGQYSAATIRGTRWLTQDRCGSTLTRVSKGVVSVRDEVKKKTVIVRAGKSYTARARR